MNKLGLLFDGDILVYRAGFAAERRIYRPAPGTLLDRDYTGLRWTSAKAAKEDVARLGYNYKTEVTWERNPEPVEHATHNLNSLINTIQTDISMMPCHGTYSKPNEIQSYIFLTGCGTKPNFREAIDPGYKANRDPTHKPIHLEALKNHLINNYPTIITQGCEADDYLAQAQTDMKIIHPEFTPVIVTLDKDLNQIEGYKYDFVDKDMYLVNEDEGLKFFFRQMVSGDKADNIPGLKGYGPVKVENLFAKCTTVDSYGRVAIQAYISTYGSLASARATWNRNCDLLWIWRKVPDECPYKVSP